jgi:hypothetical protein
MYLSALQLSSFDLARSAGSYTLIPTSDLIATVSVTLDTPLASAPATAVPYSPLPETSVNDVIWVGVRRPS